MFSSANTPFLSHRPIFPHLSYCNVQSLTFHPQTSHQRTCTFESARHETAAKCHSALCNWIFHLCLKPCFIVKTTWIPPCNTYQKSLFMYTLPRRRETSNSPSVWQTAERKEDRRKRKCFSVLELKSLADVIQISHPLLPRPSGWALPKNLCLLSPFLWAHRFLWSSLGQWDTPETRNTAAHHRKTSAFNGRTQPSLPLRHTALSGCLYSYCL